MVLMHELFFEAASKFTDRNAVVWDTISSVTAITYGELLSETDIVVDNLQSLDVCCEYVAIELDSLLVYPALVLGILRSKCAYVVLDTRNSLEWNSKLLSRLRVRIVITDGISELVGRWKVLGKINIHNRSVSIMSDNERFHNCDKKVDFMMMYAIQTSGTTGRPKTVQVPHQSIVPNILQLRSTFEVGPCDTVFLSSPLTFDPSVVETFIALSSGACLLIAPNYLRTAPGSLLFQFLFNKSRKYCGNVSILAVTPSYAACLLWDSDTASSLATKIHPDLKILSLGGEPCPSISILKDWKRKLGRRTRIFSLYGITEVSCWATITEVFFDEKHDLQAVVKHKSSHENVTNVPFSICSKNCLGLDEETSQEDNMNGGAHADNSLGNEQTVSGMGARAKDTSDVPLGVAMYHTIIEVRDSNGDTVSDGEGELFIGSDTRVCLLDDEEMDSKEQCKVIFRSTGDIVSVKHPSHQFNQARPVFHYKGRQDGTFKRFGQWVFAESVEGASYRFSWNHGNTHTSILSACCVWCIDEDGRGKLGLFVAPSRKEMFQEPEPMKQKFVRDIASYLTRVLPSNSWPDIIIPVREMPLTKHAKVDKENLKERLKNYLNGKVAKKIDATEKRPDKLMLSFKSLWMQYVKSSHEPSSSDKFLLSGGDSLLALRLVSELEDMYNCSMPPMLLLKLINGSYEDVCSCIELMASSSNENRATASSSNSVWKRILPGEHYPCRKRYIIQDSEYEDAYTEGKKGHYYHDDQLFVEYARGRMVRYHLSSEILPTRVSVGKSPVLSQKWKYDFGKCVDASPVVLHCKSSKHVVVGSHSHLLAAVTVETGDQVFSSELPDRIESSVCSSLCGQFLFVGCYDHCLYCVHLPDGKITWSFSTGGIVKSSPLIMNDGEAVVFGSYDEYLYCLSIKEGDLLWKIKPHTGSIYSSPALYQPSLANSFLNEYQTEQETIEAHKAAVVSSGIILCATLGGGCAALTEREGRILWTHDLQAPVFTSPLVFDHFVVFSSVRGKVTCFSVEHGEKVWSFQAGGNVFSSFSYLKVDGSQRLIVFGCHDHYVYCLSEGGELKWKTLVDAPVFGIPFVFPVKYDGTLKDKLPTTEKEDFTPYWVVTTSTAGHLYLLDAYTGTIKLDMNVTGQIFSSPVVYQNYVMFGCRDNFLYCFTIV